MFAGDATTVGGGRRSQRRAKHGEMGCVEYAPGDQTRESLSTCHSCGPSLLSTAGLQPTCGCCAAGRRGVTGAETVDEAANCGARQGVAPLGCQLGRACARLGTGEVPRGPNSTLHSFWI